jgi:hypothetical protein
MHGYHYRKDEMRAAAQKQGHEVFASVDSLRRDGVTVSQRFVSFASHEQFARAVLDAPPDARCFYEMIREGQPCKLYFDVEWLSSTSSVDSVVNTQPSIEGVKRVVEAAFNRAWPGRPLGECVELDGSRETPKGFKHSFHLVYPDVVFACNNRSLKRFAERVADAAARAFGGTRCVDCAVYTRDRAFRAPLCFKLADPNKTALRWSVAADDGDEVLQQVMRSMVTCVAPGADTVPELLAAVAATARTTTAAAEVPQPKEQQCLTDTENVATLRGLLQRFLARRGGKGRVCGACVVEKGGGIGFRYAHGVCNRPEPCLAHGPFSTVQHNCDNQFIHVDTEGYVTIACPHGAKCSRRFFNYGRLMHANQPAVRLLLGDIAARP